MPDVVGKSETEARELLADLGVDDVRVSEVENVAAPGTVLDQVPNSKSTITGPVDLTIAKGLSPMPELVGKSLAEVKSYFDERGVTYTIEERLDDVTSEGSILSTTPSAGQSIGAEVKLVIAKRPVTQFLSELEPVESCPDRALDRKTGDVGVNGATQQNSLWFISNGRIGTTCYVDFNLSRDWQTLRGFVGVSDTSNGNSQCQFEVFVDNGATGVFNQPAVLGTLTPVEIDITNALRVRLRVTMASATTTDCVWASIRLVGSGDSD